MSTTVSYKGQTLATVSNQTKTLLTEGKYLEDDITLEDVSGGGAVLGIKNITANGTYEAEDDSLDGYSEVTVAVPASAVDSGTKNITANGNGQDVVGYAAVNVSVPNSYSAGDEGKVVDNGALVAQTSDTVTQNDTYDTTLINELTVNVSGGGSGIDLSDIAKAYSLESIGGLFKAFEDGTWDSSELSVTSGTNPATVNFGRAIKGFIAYPQNVSFSNLANNERHEFVAAIYGEPDGNGVQNSIWQVHRRKNGGAQSPLFNRAATSLTNGVFSITFDYPSNANYHPFGFGIPYIFVYWWEESEE